MTKVIIIGHGGYASGIKRNLGMLIGEVKDYRYIDFNEQDDLNVLKEKIAEELKNLEGCDILFCCDLAGGSPFREAAVICLEHENYAVVAGINTAAYTEMTFNLELPPKELASLAAEVAKEAILIFPQ